MPKRLALTLIVVAVAAAGPAGGSMAETVKAGGLVIYAPWARASAGRAPNAAAYVSIHDHGAGDRLLGAETAVADRVEPHTHETDGAIMRMRPLDGIDIGGGQRVTLKPGGRHLMLMGLKAPLKEGDRFAMVLRFERAGRVTVTVEVLGVGAMGPQGTHHRDGPGGHDRRDHERHERGPDRP